MLVFSCRGSYVYVLNLEFLIENAAVQNSGVLHLVIFKFFCRIPMWDLSRILRIPDFCICENKGADQLRGNREADQRLCFRYIDSTIPLLSKYELTSL